MRTDSSAVVPELGPEEPTVAASSPAWPEVVTADGSLVPIFGLREEHVSLDQVARALACRQRWAGCTAGWWSVAQHSLAGARCFREQGRADLALAFLLHDVGEAFLPDIPAPLKPHVQVGGESWEALERQHREVILSAIGAPWGIEVLIDTREVRRMDAALALRERDVLLPNCARPWALDFQAEPAEVTLDRAPSPSRAALEWKQLFHALVAEVLA